MLKCQTQVVQVHLQPFWRNSLLKCVSQPEIAKKNSLKPLYFEGSGSFKIINVDINKKLITLLVMISSISVLICNRVHGTGDNGGKITTF